MKSKGLVLGLVPLTAGFLRADDAKDRNKVEDRWVEISVEEQAVRAIAKLGGHVVRDDKAPGQPVGGVDLSFTKVADGDLKNLAVLSQLHTLRLEGTRVTDAGLKDLAPLKQLKELGLVDTAVTLEAIDEFQKAHPRLLVELRPVIRRADQINGQNSPENLSGKSTEGQVPRRRRP